MTSAYLFYSPQFRPLSSAGAILPNCYVQFYAAGTTDPADVYADGALTTPLSNPVVADASGEFPAIYLDPATTYRAILYDEDDVEIWDIDPLAPPRDVPSGTIVMFHGTPTERDAAYPPATWQVCDGTNGSPDMTGRFPLQAGGGVSSGDTGGSSSANTDAAGGHDHGGASGSHTLTSDEIPAHRHQLLGSVGAGEATPLSGASSAGISGHRNGGTYDYHDDPVTGGPLVENTGGGSGHTHSISSVADHQHSVSIAPPFVALWYLMRL
jgi:hypothetical protein